MKIERAAEGTISISVFISTPQLLPVGAWSLLTVAV
jgi:hypothetical protein